jgi:hypothetical protein
MNASFRYYSLQKFSELNNNVLNKFNHLGSKEIDKNIANIMKIEETFNEIESKLDNSLNYMITLQVNKSIEKELNFIN